MPAGLRCFVCENIEESDSFSSTVTGNCFKINHRLGCNKSCLICLLPCKVCKKRYSGKRVDKFKLRWNKYKGSDRNFRGGDIKEMSLHQHFVKEELNGFIEDINNYLTDKTQFPEPLKKVNQWMRRLGNPLYLWT